MPVTMSRPIFPKHVTFGGTVGSENDGHLEKEKEMPKNDLD